PVSAAPPDLSFEGTCRLELALRAALEDAAARLRAAPSEVLTLAHVLDGTAALIPALHAFLDGVVVLQGPAHRQARRIALLRDVARVGDDYARFEALGA
ncbi:hypothetical protein H632_c4082p0, partial [Helicosporidium sp. ATCC 50920]